MTETGNPHQEWKKWWSGKVEPFFCWPSVLPLPSSSKTHSWGVNRGEEATLFLWVRLHPLFVWGVCSENLSIQHDSKGKKKKLIIFLDIIFNISSCFLSRTSFITPPITPPKTGIKMPSLAMFPTQNVKLSSCVWGVYLRLQDGPVKLTKTKLLAAACQEHLKATSFTCEPACWGWRKVFGCNMDAFV